MGHVPALLWRQIAFMRSLRSVGEMVRVDLGTWPVYFVTVPEHVHQILVTQASHFDRGRIFERSRSIFGVGLGTLDGPEHHERRRLLQPAFHQARIRSYVAVMVEAARAVVESWRPGQTVAVDHAMHELTLTIVTGSMFSRSLARPAAEEVHQILPVIVQGGTARALLPRWLDHLPIPIHRRFNAAGARLRAVVDQLIIDYQADGLDGHDMLTMLMNARDETGGRPDPVQVRDDAMTIMLGGAETAAVTLAWTFHELSRNPRVERRLRAEIDTVVGSGPVSLDDLPQLRYTRQVLQETLRLHSLIVFMRRATASVRIGEVDVPAGTELAYSLYALHRDPAVFPDPDRFDPDRWLPERKRSHPQHSFLPFGEGRHKCIGDVFALTEMVVILATVLGRWELRPVSGHVVREVPAAIPRPNALPMTVHSRDRVPTSPPR